MPQSEEGSEMPAEERAREHANELERLVKSVDATHARRRCKLADEVVDGGHEARDSDTVHEAQQGELPRCRHEALRDGDKPCEQQAGRQHTVRADTVGDVAEPLGKQHARKARTRENSTCNHSEVIRRRRKLLDIDRQDWLDTGQRELHDERRQEESDNRAAMRQSGK